MDGRLRVLRYETNDFSEGTMLRLPKKLKRKFYHLGLPFLLKKMKKAEVKGLIKNVINCSDDESEDVFRQLKGVGFLLHNDLFARIMGGAWVLTLHEEAYGKCFHYTPRYDLYGE
jgi:hypothetical protein